MQIPVQEAINQLKPIFKSMEGKLEWYCLDYWSNKLQLDIVGLKQEIADLISILPHVMDFLETVSNSEKQVLLVTNAQRDSLNLKMERTCLQVFFDQIISSHDYGIPKEHQDFWKILNQHHSFEKEHTLLVDDSLAVLNTARQYGIEYLISINQPDSTKPKKKTNDFRSITDFRELMPGF
jgi:putative hydrolase of the HAD superfamily